MPARPRRSTVGGAILVAWRRWADHWWLCRRPPSAVHVRGRRMASTLRHAEAHREWRRKRWLAVRRRRWRRRLGRRRGSCWRTVIRRRANRLAKRQGHGPHLRRRRRSRVAAPLPRGPVPMVSWRRPSPFCTPEQRRQRLAALQWRRGHGCRLWGWHRAHRSGCPGRRGGQGVGRALVLVGLRGRLGLSWRRPGSRASGGRLWNLAVPLQTASAKSSESSTRRRREARVLVGRRERGRRRRRRRGRRNRRLVLLEII